jgi:hypothetical protein
MPRGKRGPESMAPAPSEALAQSSVGRTPAVEEMNRQAAAACTGFVARADEPAECRSCGAGVEFHLQACSHAAIADKLATRLPTRQLVCPDCGAEVPGTKGTCSVCGRPAEGAKCAGCQIDAEEGALPLTSAAPEPSAQGPDGEPMRCEVDPACVRPAEHDGDCDIPGPDASGTPVPEVDQPWKAEQTGTTDRGERILAVHGKVKLSHEARERKGVELCTALHRLEELQDELKATTKRYRGLIDEQLEAVQGLRDAYEIAVEDGMISCREVVDIPRGIVELRAVDDDRIVATRTVEDKDRQLSLGIAAAAAEAVHQGEDVPPAPTAEEIAEAFNTGKAPEVCIRFEPAADDDDQTRCGKCGWDTNDHMVCQAWSESSKSSGRCFNCGATHEEHLAAESMAQAAEASAGA